MRDALLGLLLLSCSVLACAWQFYPHLWAYSVLPWALSSLAALMLLGKLDSKGATKNVWKEEPWSSGEVVAVTVLLIIALGLRAWKLTELPYWIHHDETAFGLVRRLFLRENAPSPFGASRIANLPNLQFYFWGATAVFWGDNFFSLRLFTVITGVLSLVPSFLLLRLLFGRSAALITLALTVPYHWHVHYSRLGMSYMHGTALAVWCFYFAVRGLARDRRLCTGLAGVFLGLGIQSYFACRILPPVLICWFGVWALWFRPSVRSVLGHALIVFSVALLVCLPMLFSFHHSGASYFGREGAISVFSPGQAGHVSSVVGSSAFGDVLRYQLARTFGFFCCYGDTAPIYGYPKPFVDPILRPLFLLGVAWSLTRLREIRWQLLWIWYMAVLIGGNVLVIDPVASYHPLILSSTVLIFVGALLSALSVWTRDRLPAAARPAVTAAIMVLIGLSWFTNWNEYFVFYAGWNRSSVRDSIVRFLETRGDISRIANLTREAQDFHHLTYQFFAPAVQGYNLSLDQDGPEGLIRRVSAIERPLLVVYGTKDKMNPVLLDRLKPRQTGIVSDTAFRKGFSWMLLE